MKQILTLLLLVGAFTAAQAQTSRDEARRVILGDRKGDNRTTSSGNGRDVILGGGNNGNNYPGSYPSGDSRQTEIDRINREYEAKIQSIRNNPYLSAEEKDRAIRQLERDRQRRINQINGQYNRRNNGNCDDEDRYERRHDHGKHKGWYKNGKHKGRHHDDDDDD